MSWRSLLTYFSRRFGPTNRTIPVLPKPSLDCVIFIREAAAATTVIYPSITVESELSIMGSVRESRAYD